ncbi:hypothetical protein RBB78_01645 [Tunturiibacter empetritectus]|uniref:hypothetical protein n=1 Tax=Tunturiibacter empetritectus TaxID=3069691 RepID=UPI003D9BDD15
MGWRAYPEDGNTVQTILRAADTMMYEAKKTRDNVAVAGKGMIGRAETAKPVGSRREVSGMFLERDSIPRN